MRELKKLARDFLVTRWCSVVLSGAIVPHNAKVVGSSPTLATNLLRLSAIAVTTPGPHEVCDSSG